MKEFCKRNVIILTTLSAAIVVGFAVGWDNVKHLAVPAGIGITVLSMFS